jgi:hypothetical protein
MGIGLIDGKVAAETAIFPIIQPLLSAIAGAISSYILP